MSAAGEELYDVCKQGDVELLRSLLDVMGVNDEDLHRMDQLSNQKRYLRLSDLCSDSDSELGVDEETLSARKDIEDAESASRAAAAAAPAGGTGTKAKAHEELNRRQLNSWAVRNLAGIAAKAGNHEVVQYLLTRGMARGHHYDVLRVAASKCNVTLCKQLLAIGVPAPPTVRGLESMLQDLLQCDDDGATEMLELLLPVLIAQEKKLGSGCGSAADGTVSGAKSALLSSEESAGSRTSSVGGTGAGRRMGLLG